MSKLTLGFVISVIGMGGTLLSLYLITVVIDLLKRILPYREAQETDVKEVV